MLTHSIFEDSEYKSAVRRYSKIAICFMLGVAGFVSLSSQKAHSANISQPPIVSPSVMDVQLVSNQAFTRSNDLSKPCLPLLSLAYDVALNDAMIWNQHNAGDSRSEVMFRSVSIALPYPEHSYISA